MGSTVGISRRGFNCRRFSCCETNGSSALPRLKVLDTDNVGTQMGSYVFFLFLKRFNLCEQTKLHFHNVNTQYLKLVLRELTPTS